jgi:hypothetical protein
MGFLFHLTQAWYRKIQELSLSTEYKNKSSSVGKWLRHLFGLPFLPPVEVGDMFCLQFMSNKPDHGNVTQFCDYLVDNYIAENSKLPPPPPFMGKNEFKCCSHYQRMCHFILTFVKTFTRRIQIFLILLML